jgi:hypothetical protein
MRFVGYALAAFLGLAAGIAAIAVHRTFLGLLLGAGTAVLVIWTLRQWLPRAGTAFAAGWLVPLLAAITGRGEGDYAVSADSRGWLLIVAGFVVLVTGIAWGRPPTVRHDSGSAGVPT